jgi:hypothetical protein
MEHRTVGQIVVAAPARAEHMDRIELRVGKGRREARTSDLLGEAGEGR